MNILLVVGTLFPFDRLVKLLDHWASGLDGIRVIGQIGKGTYRPLNIEAHSMLSAKEFNRIFEESDLIVTHAGMGIILKSLVSGKPIVVLPRRLELKEHTTDHQMATAKALDKMGSVHIAWTDEDLLDFLKDPTSIGTRKSIGEFASDQLLDAIRDFIQDN